MSVETESEARRPLVPRTEPRETVLLDGERVHSVAEAAAALPDPDSLAPGTLLLVPGAPPRAGSFATRLFRALSGGKPVSRAVRCSALVARGYVDVAAASAGEPNRDDVAWGYAPTTELC